MKGSEGERACKNKLFTLRMSQIRTRSPKRGVRERVLRFFIKKGLK